MHTYIFHGAALNASNYGMEISYEYEWNLFYVAICIISHIVLITGSVDLKSNKQIFVCADTHTSRVSNLTQMLNKNSDKWYAKEVFSEPHVWTNEEVKLKTKNNGHVKHLQRNQFSTGWCMAWLN